MLSMKDNTMYGKYLNDNSDDYYVNTKTGRYRVPYSEFKKIYTLKQKIGKSIPNNIGYNTASEHPIATNKPEMYFPVNGIIINN
jgi:hypothetical protein